MCKNDFEFNEEHLWLKDLTKAPRWAGQGGMMQQLQRMQQQLAEAQAKLADETVTATAGGGAIKVVMTGDQKCKSVEINRRTC